MVTFGRAMQQRQRTAQVRVHEWKSQISSFVCRLMCVSIDCVLLSVVMFDPACFYGHHEYDLAIAGMFGGFTRQFYDEYHSIIPESCWF